MGIQDGYVLRAPDPAHAVGLFEGEWSSSLPGDLGVEAGPLPLFADDRLTWAVERLGGVDGMRVLELGPLEGGHTYGLLQAGAAHVTAVEASPRAWLRCLVAKELLGMQNANFLLGGAEAYLRASDETLDLGWCSGLLYHLADPHSTLVRLAERCDALFIWTHVFDPEVALRHEGLAEQFDNTTRIARVAGHDVTLHRHLYGEAVGYASFCGGARPDSWWLQRSSLFDLLAWCGFGDVDVAFEEPDHPNGPALALVARRTGDVLVAAEALEPGTGDADAAPGDTDRADIGAIPALPTPALVAELRGDVATLRRRIEELEATAEPAPSLARRLVGRLRRIAG